MGRGSLVKGVRLVESKCALLAVREAVGIGHREDIRVPLVGRGVAVDLSDPRRWRLLGDLIDTSIIDAIVLR